MSGGQLWRSGLVEGLGGLTRLTRRARPVALLLATSTGRWRRHGGRADQAERRKEKCFLSQNNGYACEIVDCLLSLPLRSDPRR